MPRPGPDLRTVFRWGVAAAAGAGALLLVGWAVYGVRDLLVQVFIAMFVAISLDPAVRWLVRHRIRRPWAVTIVILSALVFVAGFLLAVVPPLVQQAQTLADDAPHYLDQLRRQSERLRGLEDQFHFRAKLDAWLRDLPATLGTQALGFGRRFFGALASFLLIFVLSLYFMLDLPRLLGLLVGAVPESRRERVSDGVNVLIDKIGSYMIGNIVISLIAGVAAFAALEILRVPFALPLAFLVAFTDLIPMIGATLGAAICVLVALASVPLWPQAIGVVLFFVVYQQLENYLIAPRVMRNAVDMPAIGVLLAALVGGQILGLVGALMAIPVAAAIKIIYVRGREARRERAVEAPAGE
ncbi:AI-2E family transporter [Longispora sp. NPDC051575]|uniref:AI-2E family transporter n=1 Tax=Longispora sp. NPDC051575 TaxID=3154943 RepID=UPI00342E4BF2